MAPSFMAEQAKILVAEAEDNNLDDKVLNERWKRWEECSLCEQNYHGVVACALGWASWKTYVNRPEADWARRSAMTQLGNGLSDAYLHEDALSVGEAELSMLRRLGAPEEQLLVAQGNLAGTYEALGRPEALQMKRDVFTGYLKLYGAEEFETLIAAFNCTNTLGGLKRFEEAKSLLRKTIPVARRVLGESHDLTLRMKRNYAAVL